MKKIAFILLIILTSCGSRKREAEKKVEIKTSKEVLNSNTVISYKKDFDLSEVIIQPLDNQKPMIIDGKKFENVKITKKTDKSIEKKNEEIKVESKKEEKSKVKEQQIKVETSNKAIWFYLFLAIVAVALIYFFKRWWPFVFQSKK